MERLSRHATRNASFKACGLKLAARMIEIIPLRGNDPDHAVHTVALPIRAFGSGAARFFAVVVEASTPPGSGTPRRAGSIATTLENIAENDDLPREPAAWFSAYITRLRERLHDRRNPTPLLLSICLGIAYPLGDRIAVTLTRSGAVGAFLISRHARARAVAMDILEPATAPSTSRFEHAVDGAMHGDDLLIVGTSELTGHAARITAIQACAQLAPSAAAAAITHAVLRTHPSAQGLVVAGSHSSSSHPRSQRSMDTFLETATSTEHFLTPRLVPALRKYVTQLRATASLVTRRRRRRMPSNRFLPFVQHAVQLTIRTIVITIRSIGAMVIDGMRLLSIAVVRFVRVLSQLRIKRFISLRNTLTTNIAHFRPWYRSLPRTSQRLFVLTAIFATLFLISTGALWRRRAADLSVAAYNATIARIEELRSVAEARLLFNDRTAARDALHEAEAALTMLPRTTRARRERVAMLDGEIRASLDRARLMVRIAQPLRVARGGDGGIPFTAIGGFSVVGTRLTAVAMDGSAVAVIDPRNGDVTPYPFTSSQLLSRPLRTLTLDDRSIMLIDTSAHAVRIDVRAGAATAITIEQPPPEIRDAALFQGRLYLLLPDGQITRHARTTGGFSRGTTWLRADGAPANVQRLFVAGPVFLSSGDGALAAYFAGRRRDTNLRKDIDPPLSTAALLTAPPDQELLYLGDPTEGRIIAVRTNGELIGQIQSNTFRGMADLAVDATGSAIYVLHENEISVVVPPKEGR